jgi:hypothetical protein
MRGFLDVRLEPSGAQLPSPSPAQVPYKQPARAISTFPSANSSTMAVSIPNFFFFQSPIELLSYYPVARYPSFLVIGWSFSLAASFGLCPIEQLIHPYQTLLRPFANFE